MTVSATEGGGFLPPTGPGPSTASSPDKDMFLQLLVTQLKYQDPLNPSDQTQFLAQTAQFTSLEKMEAVADQTAQSLAAQLAFGASGLVGRSVTYTDGDGQQLTGTVASVRLGATGPQLSIDGAQVPMDSIVAIGRTPSSTGTGDGAATEA